MTQDHDENPELGYMILWCHDPSQNLWCELRGSGASGDERVLLPTLFFKTEWDAECFGRQYFGNDPHRKGSEAQPSMGTLWMVEVGERFGESLITFGLGI